MRQHRNQSSQGLQDAKQHFEVLEIKTKVSQSSSSKKRSKVLGMDASAYTMADFCDLAVLGEGCGPRSFVEIREQLETQTGSMNEMLTRLRESRFSSLVDEDPESGPALNAATLLTVCELRREVGDLANIPKSVMTKRTKARADGSGKRKHKTLLLDRPIDLLVNIVAVYGDRFEVGIDGVPKLAEHVGSTILRERFFKLLDGRVNLAHFRRCAHSKCGRVFYAAREDQLCCSARCNNARWQGLWYAADPEHAKSVIYQRANRKQGQGR
jgi:hypothetical protein